jgi:hypothetical protein
MDVMMIDDDRQIMFDILQEVSSLGYIYVSPATTTLRKYELVNILRIAAQLVSEGLFNLVDEREQPPDTRPCSIAYVTVEMMTRNIKDHYTVPVYLPQKVCYLEGLTEKGYQCLEQIRRTIPLHTDSRVDLP